MAKTTEPHESAEGIWLITELGAAIRHLENALQVNRTPQRVQLPDGTTVSEAQLCLWVARNTDRTQLLLDRIQVLLTTIAAESPTPQT